MFRTSFVTLTNVLALPEIKAIVMHAKLHSPSTLLSRFDLDIIRLTNVTARILRLYKKYKKNGDKPLFDLPTAFVSKNDNNG